MYFSSFKLPSSSFRSSFPKGGKNISRGLHSSNEVVILGAARTPTGGFLGSLSSLSAPELGAIAIKGAMERAKINPKEIQEVYMGNVVQSNVGQAPARQAVIKSGLSVDVEATTINKVCASGMKAITLAAQGILTNTRDVMIAGGMESMSNVPFYQSASARTGNRLGHQQLFDGIIKDGLWDVYNDIHMGNCAEACAKKYNITREQQDKFAIETYRRAGEAWRSGAFTAEVAPVTITGKKGESTVILEDEEYKKLKLDKLAQLKPAFDKNGSVTAANSSGLNDGASAVVMASRKKAEELGLKPLARIIGFADAAQAPIDFPTSPSKAIPIALKRAGLTIQDIGFWEINQAFAVVSLANMQILGLDPSKVDANGGAVALGHPIGSSGSRIVVSLLHTLIARNAKYGVAAICNGGGGSTAIVIEKL